MTTTEISSKKKWEKAHPILSFCLEKEIRLMREVLTTLHQEELALLEHEMRRWKKEIRHLSDLIVDLKGLREKRIAATKELTLLRDQLNREELFPAEEESSCEILSKLDQIMALISRINLQNCRNGALFEQVKKSNHAPLSCLYPHPLHQPKRKKTSVATCSKKG